MKRPNNSSLKNFTNESVNEGKYDSELDKVEAAVKNATSFMNVGAELKKAGIKYDFSTSMIPMYRIKVSGNTIAIVNKKYAAGAEREVNDIAIGIMENTVKKSVNEGNNPGDKFTHKHNPKIEIELIEPTNKGWKVYQTEKGKKKIAYFDKQDISGNNSLFKSVNEAFTHQKVKNRIYFELDKRESANTSVQKKK
jgi:hypothetical protein